MFAHSTAKAIETALDGLIIVAVKGGVKIPWEKCSKRLVRASFAERSHVELSPAGDGIHWPLIDEDLAVGPLLESVVSA